MPNNQQNTGYDPGNEFAQSSYLNPQDNGTGQGQSGIPQGGFVQQEGLPQYTQGQTQDPYGYTPQNGGFNNNMGYQSQNGGFNNNMGYQSQNGGFNNNMGYQSQGGFQQYNGYQPQGNFTPAPYDNGGYQNNGYAQGAYPQNPTPGFSIASLVFGVLSLLLLCCLRWWDFILIIPAIVLGILGLKKEPNGKAMSIIGIICAALALILVILLIIAAVSMLNWAKNAGSAGFYQWYMKMMEDIVQNGNY